MRPLDSTFFSTALKRWVRVLVRVDTQGAWTACVSYPKPSAETASSATDKPDEG